MPVSKTKIAPAVMPVSRNVIWITKHSLHECRAIIGRQLFDQQYLVAGSFDPGYPRNRRHSTKRIRPHLHVPRIAEIPLITGVATQEDHPRVSRLARAVHD